MKLANLTSARGSLRFSLGLYNTDEDVDYVLKHLPGIIAKLRAISPLDANHQDNDQFDLKAARQKHDHTQAHSGPDGATVTV